MKRALIPLVVCFYAVVVAFLLTIYFTNYAEEIQVGGLIVVGIFSLLIPILLVVNCVVAAMQKSGNDIISYKKLAKTVMLVKFVMIPWFVANLIIWGMFTLFSVVPAFMFLIFIAPAIGIICGYLALLASSIYTVAMIIRLRKRGIITKGQSVLHIILQLIFVTDLISSILLVKQLAYKAK